MKTKHYIQILPVIGALAVLTGCAIIPGKVELSYSPAPGSKTPLSEVKPLTVSLNVQDEREASVRNRVGDKRNAYGMAMAKVKSKRDLPFVLREALKRELEANGHTVTETPAQAIASINVALKVFMSDSKSRALDVEMRGTVSADVEIKDRHTSAPPLKKMITATTREGAIGILDAAYEKVLNRALAEFVRNFAFDSEVVKTLQAIGGVQSSSTQLNQP